MFKVTSHALDEHAQVPLTGDGKLETIVAHWRARDPRTLSTTDRENNADYVVSVSADRDPRVQLARLAEIVSLVDHQGDEIVGRESCHVANPNPRTLLVDALTAWPGGLLVASHDRAFLSSIGVNRYMVLGASS